MPRVSSGERFGASMPFAGRHYGTQDEAIAAVLKYGGKWGDMVVFEYRDHADCDRADAPVDGLITCFV